MSQPVAEIAARGAAALQELPGIGKSLSAQIIEIIETGTSSFFEELKEEIPESVLELRRVSGIGLKTSQLLYQDFGIKSLDELKAFADGGGLESVSVRCGHGGQRVSRTRTWPPISRRMSSTLWSILIPAAMLTNMIAEMMCARVAAVPWWRTI